MSKNYEGICAACDRESKYLERDHRIPPRLGGDMHSQFNLQDLCLECHKRKTMLEASLMSYDGSSETVSEWLTLAFQDDVKRMKLFADNLSMRASHIREVTVEHKARLEKSQIKVGYGLLR